MAGVTDTNSRGGHGSASAVRSTEAVAKAAASLGNQPPTTSADREALRAAVAREPGNAGLHHSLAAAEEKQGDALNAAREYQRAAELDATENNLFDWASELLTHHAAEQAGEVFAKGNRLFPRSVRMRLGLGAALYSRGSYQDAAHQFFAAVDLNPNDPAPYLFLGKIQTPEIAQVDGYTARLARFVRLQPRNPWANYYYAASLWTGWQGPEDRQTTRKVRTLLQKAVRLDPKLAAAHLQLGILLSSLRDFRKAIPSYRAAIANGTEQAEVHYRLAQAYQRTGEDQKARQEFELYEQSVKASAAEEERARTRIQQFVFGLREKMDIPPR